MNEGAPPNRWARWGTPVVAAVLVIGGYLAWRHYHAEAPTPGGSGSSEQQAKAAPVPVTVDKVASGSFPVFLDGLGTVQAFNSVVVHTRVDGQIIKLAVKEGQMVKQGDLIAQIDPRPLQAALDQAIAKRTQDTANLKNANLDLQRYTTLAKQSFATGQQLDTQKSTVNQATAQIASDDAAIDNARTQLGYATITAPITGRTGLRFVDEGNIIHASDPNGLISILQIQPISVVFTAPEDQVDRINQAQSKAPLKAIALSSDGTRQLAEGALSVVSNQVDVATGTIQLKATFANKDSALWPGLSVTTRLLIDTLQNATLIPADAVQHGQDGLFAYVVGDDKKAHVQKIKVSNSDEGKAVVTDGLRPGQTVVTEGQYRLQEGAQVAAQDAAAAQTAVRD